jgi:chaperonin GroES
VIVFSWNTSRKKSRSAGASSSRTVPKKSPKRLKSSPSARAKKGEDGKISTFEVKVGDRVLISKYGGTEVKLDDKKYTLVREDDILGVIA